MIKNPFVNLYGLGGAVPTYPMPMPSMVTPEQYKQDLLNRLQPQLDQYNAMYYQSQAQAQMQSNSGQYFKVNSFDEAKAITPPADGRPVMIFDETNGRLYAKRFENGNTFIKGFQLTELEESAEATPKAEAPAPAPKETEASEGKTPSSDGEVLKAILERFDSLDNRLSALEGKK